MQVKIRLQRHGRKKQPFYHIVVADARAPRDGRFIEKLGVYNPMTKPATIDLDRDRAYEWLVNGAQPTETARAILRFKGVLYKKHLMRGVQKGALTEEQAQAKWEKWVEDKETRIRKRREASEAEKKAHWEHVSGSIPKVVVREEEPAEETSEAAEAGQEVAAEASAETAEAEEQATPAAEEAPAAEDEASEAEASAAEEAPAAATEEEEAAEEDEDKSEA